MSVVVERMILGPVSTNCYYFFYEGQKECVVVDPADRGQYIFDILEKKGLVIAGILLTHGHFDHISGAEELRKLSKADIYALDMERNMLTDKSLNLSGQMSPVCSFEADEYLKDNQEIVLGNFDIKVIATPGHTSGSCCYYLQKEGILFSGDTLFCESVGRTDLPTGSGRELKESIRNKLSVLPDETVVYPGHDVETTIGHEKEYNSFWI